MPGPDAQRSLQLCVQRVPGELLGGRALFVCHRADERQETVILPSWLALERSVFLQRVVADHDQGEEPSVEHEREARIPRTQ